MGCPSVSRRFIEGHIGQERFIDVWERKFSRYRQGRRQSAPNVCGTCEEWDLCEGGGFHLFDPEDKDAETCSLRKIADKGESHA
jgi:radical SAM protein with 4Fe4S-binding SPASM domain